MQEERDQIAVRPRLTHLVQLHIWMVEGDPLGFEIDLDEMHPEELASGIEERALHPGEGQVGLQGRLVEVIALHAHLMREAIKALHADRMREAIRGHQKRH